MSLLVLDLISVVARSLVKGCVRGLVRTGVWCWFHGVWYFVGCEELELKCDDTPDDCEVEIILFSETIASIDDVDGYLCS